jgi:hypothetical protein
MVFVGKEKIPDDRSLALIGPLIFVSRRLPLMSKDMYSLLKSLSL